MDDCMLSMRGITKKFGATVALDNVDFSVRRGEVHALLGENGAGKSTLMKVFSGVYPADAGQILLDGVPVCFANTRMAVDGGVSLIFQELNLVSTLTTVENAFLGRLWRNRWGAVDWKGMAREFSRFMASIDFEMDPLRPVSELSIAEKQMVEIARALMHSSKVIVMDEPTATLTTEEIRKLFNIIRILKGQGVTVIYISHRLEEVYQICDRLTVLRDGRAVCTRDVAETTKAQLIEHMVGRSMEIEFPERTPHTIGEGLLEIRDLCTPGFLKDINLTLRRGEILGLAGLVGSGRTEIARAVFGADKVERGEFRVNGRKVAIRSTMEAKKLSIGLVPEDRKEEGLAVEFSVMKNITVTNLARVSRGIFLSRRREAAEAGRMVRELGIKTASIHRRADQLSGGNQQKVVLAKWLYNDADILILDEPTRGIDVGA
ncbi:MAG: sugar ABC transporter ATP-binding protein, partial [Eubacteriales bacterium]|nr:sugar ABC transporter ATP-binding protein [Eubacteriales bacterium]